ncbi:cupin domain-containing protein [Leisingera daeponensis]|uniref:Cupin domain-containing protein n=1 Tax=Leisingera daeponensis TaxID=405746 RepID=A0ABS7NJ08_9RHOB|nr:cupin domain-containing protein [Leisingera daeponensis]MBY6141178.1 cupin domain-containing protein [Leisingera daeponensis]
MGDQPQLFKFDLVQKRYDSMGDSDTYIKPMVTSEFSKSMCGGINVLNNIKVPWELTCDEIIFCLEGTFRLVCDGKEYICNRGDVLFVPKDNHISYEADGKCVIFYAAYPHNWKQLAGITAVPGIDPADFVAG